MLRALFCLAGLGLRLCQLLPVLSHSSHFSYLEPEIFKTTSIRTFRKFIWLRERDHDHSSPKPKAQYGWLSKQKWVQDIEISNSSMEQPARNNSQESGRYYPPHKTGKHLSKIPSANKGVKNGSMTKSPRTPYLSAYHVLLGTIQNTEK